MCRHSAPSARRRRRTSAVPIPWGRLTLIVTHTITGPVATVARMVVSLDIACFALRDGGLTILLMRRRKAPHAGAWALPGGAVGRWEDLDAAARRVLAERTGVTGVYLEQLYTFGEPRRDP